MTQSIFKFPTLTAARFVVERLQQQGVSAKYLNSSFIQIQGEITDQTEATVTKELGKKVSSPNKGKTPPPSSEKKKSAPIAVKAAAAPETKAKSAPPAGKPAAKAGPNVHAMAYEALKRMVEKTPQKFPKLAKMMGLKVKG
jgi:hypothetical protein